ncbi:MAG: hypothetical protein VKP62_11820 [Candidatus Sericytochromatia bacterium]|nr:hypothetical protein [Candidatus Sericytochromatia bacterium]
MAEALRWLRATSWLLCALVMLGTGCNTWPPGQRVPLAAVELMGEEEAAPGVREPSALVMVARKRAADPCRSRRVPPAQAWAPAPDLIPVPPPLRAATARAPPPACS